MYSRHIDNLEFCNRFYKYGRNPYFTLASAHIQDKLRGYPLRRTSINIHHTFKRKTLRLADLKDDSLTDIDDISKPEILADENIEATPANLQTVSEH